MAFTTIRFVATDQDHLSHIQPDMAQVVDASAAGRDRLRWKQSTVLTWLPPTRCTLAPPVLHESAGWFRYQQKMCRARVIEPTIAAMLVGIAPR